MKKTYRLLPLLLILAQAGIQAQTAPVRRLHTQTLQRQLQEKAPALADSLSETERFVKAANPLEPAKEALIPVAFHLLYGPGQTPPGREQILGQLDALNRDFAVVKESGEAVVLHPADTLERFATRAADTQIRFCLAQSGFQEGIGYHEVNTLAWGLDPALQSAEQSGAF